MHKLALIAVALAAGVGLVGPATAGAPPTQVVVVDDFTFQSGLWTRACGFPVRITVQGTVHITLRTDRNGVLHETDAFTDWSLTYSAPSRETSVSYKFGPGFYEYPDGVYIGAPSVLTQLGIHTHVNTQPAEAGRTVSEGVVVDILPSGVPIVDTSGPLVSQTGNQLDPAASRASICAALAG